jgi:mannose-6-phosphate isomerase-like protein (cupin superfamily)
MHLHEKIAQLRREKNLKISGLHSKIKEIFGDKALSYRTLLRIEKGDTDGRGSSLHQICLGLGVSLKELRQGTEREFSIADYLKKSKREGKYIYNKGVYAEILTGAKRSFLALELVLEPQGKTQIEKDPEGEEKFEKWLYVLKGKLTCTVKGVKFILKKGDCISFDSTLPHSFENSASTPTHAILIQNPRHI